MPSDWCGAGNGSRRSSSGAARPRIHVRDPRERRGRPRPAGGRGRLRRAAAGAARLYSYEAKWVWDRPERPLGIFQCPASLPRGLARQIEQTVLAAYRVLRCRDWARIDVRCDARGVPHILEVNPLAGVLPDPAMNSCFPKAASAAGIEYGPMIRAVLRAAAARQGLAL